MLSYIARRLLAAIPVLLVVTFAAFLLLKLTPGDPAMMMLGQEATPETIAALRQELGLDRPLPEQYARFLAGAVRGDLGQSYDTQRPVREEISRALPATAQLAAAAMALSLLIGIPIGIVTAVKHNSGFDHVVRILLLLLVSIPTFWLGLMILYVFAVRLGLFPAFGSGTAQHLVLPAITLSSFSLAIIVRMTRSSLLEVVRSDYVRTARAKGLAEGRVIMGHALKNAMIPVTTVIGLQFGTLLTGAALTETVFAWPGLGQMLVTAVFARDYPLIQAGVLLIAVIFIGVNLVVDLLYSVMDPRIRYQ
jgi:peptide/nickel transport system permease protein/oligopeptide transport system permease protein